MTSLRRTGALPTVKEGDETILRAIMMSYNSIIASSRFFEFVDDLYDLKEREREIKKAIKSP